MEITNLNKDRNFRRKPSIDLTTMLYGKVPPQAKDLEDAILGIILLEPKIDIAIGILQPDSFYVEAHKRIFNAMIELYNRQQPIDCLTLVQELIRTEELEMVGGAYYITKLTNNVVSGVNIETYCRIVQQKFIAREVIRVSGELIGMAYEDGQDAFALLDHCEQELLSIGTKHIHGTAVSMPTAIFKTMARIQEYRMMETAITGVPSGFPALDYATRGWQPTDLIILAARPSVGKTALALQLVDMASDNKIKQVSVAVWSLEMETTQLMMRMIARKTQTNLRRLQTGRLDDDQFRQLQTDVAPMADQQIFFDDTPGLTMFKLRAKARRLKKKHNIGMILIDYLQLMDGDGGKNRDSELSAIAKGLKDLAMELKVPVIAISSMNRDVEKRANREPQLSDLRESGAIEFHADLIVFLWGPSNEQIEKDPTLVDRRWARIAKQRNGEFVTVALDFKGSHQHFKEAPDDVLTPVTVPAGNWKAVKGIDFNRQLPKEKDDDLFPE